MSKRSKLKLSILILLLSVLFGLYIYSKFESSKSVSEDILSLKDKDTAQLPVQNCGYAESIQYISYKDSKWDKNNKFGLYIYAENKDFFEVAQRLVNSSGGDWGYVLIPYNVKDRDYEKWNRVFEQLRNKHLIPIIQLWDVNPDKYKEQTEDAANFLNNFVWPIKDRYVSAYNEMNDRKFWYGKVDPVEYAEILDYTIDTFKNVNDTFFIMNGAFNISAGTNADHLDALDYMFEMDQTKPGIFNKLDGWASHPYPQPNFSGNPRTDGRMGIKAYEIELNYLKKNLGLKKNLPVFITETGWAHAEGENYNTSFYDTDTVSEYFETAFKEVWLKDDRVRAVTPFTIRYDAPFDHFSWISKDNIPYKHYEAIKSMKKVEGNPPHVEISNLKVAGCSDE